MDILINYLIEGIIAIFSGLLIYYYNRIKKIVKIVEANKETVLMLTKNFIKEKYYIVKERDCITVEEKETILELYREYKKLGGNDIIDNLIININNIEINENCE